MMTRPDESATPQFVFLFCDAHLTEAGEVEYSVCSLPSVGEPTFAHYTLLRSAANLEPTDPLSATNPMWRYEKNIETLRASTPSGARYTLMMPKQGNGPGVPLIVALHCSYGPDYEDSWVEVVSKYRYAVLLPALDTKGYIVSPKLDLVRADVARVRECLAVVQETLQPGATLLYAEYACGYVGHMIWQTENRDFAAFVAARAEFKGWSDAPGAQVDKAAPVYEWDDVTGSDHDRKEAEEIGRWYRARGYTDVSVAQIEGSDVKEKDLVARLLLQRAEPDQAPPGRR